MTIKIINNDSLFITKSPAYYYGIKAHQGVIVNAGKNVVEVLTHNFLEHSNCQQANGVVK
jgi:hypothetical protein